MSVPETFDDDYKIRAKAAAAAKIRAATDLDYFDHGMAQPEGGCRLAGEPHSRGDKIRKVPLPAVEDISKLRLIDKETGENITFEAQDELRHWKYQRYMKHYLRTIQSIDDNVGRMLDYLDENNLTNDTIVIYTSDRAFFLGDHGWFDKRFIYEESF